MLTTLVTPLRAATTLIVPIFILAGSALPRDARAHEEAPAKAAGAAASAPANPKKKTAGTAAAPTVTVTPGISSPILLGTKFYVTVHAAGMPKNGGATLGVSWNKAVVLATGVELAPGSPFDFLDAPKRNRFTFVAAKKPNACLDGPCSFDAVRILFTAVGPGSADILVFDDGKDKCWGDPDTFKCVAARPVYRQADVQVTLPMRVPPRPTPLLPDPPVQPEPQSQSQTP